MRWRRLAVSGVGFLVILAVALLARGSSETPARTSADGLGPHGPVRGDQAERQKDAVTSEDRAEVPTTIAFWNEQRGLAGTGRTYGGKSPGRILLTEDGGRTFRVVLRTESAVNWVDTGGTEDAWAVVLPRQSGVTKQVLHSPDGGRSWNRLAETDIAAPSFANPSTGLALTSADAAHDSPPPRSRIAATSDGGKTWNPSPNPCPREWFVDVTQPTESQAWTLCASEGAGGGAEKSVYLSADGGETWQRLAYADYQEGIVGGLELGGYPSGVNFSPDGFGIIWSDQAGLLSRDGGRTWEPPGRPFGGEVSSAAMLTSEDGFVLGGREGHGRLRVTHDAGRTWTIRHEW